MNGRQRKVGIVYRSCLVLASFLLTFEDYSIWYTILCHIVTHLYSAISVGLWQLSGAQQQKHKLQPKILLKVN